MSLPQRVLAEIIGTALIVTAVLGAGYMVSNLGAEGTVGLFVMAAVVAAVLFVAIAALGPISGAHFNPLVTVALSIRARLMPLGSDSERMAVTEVMVYLLAQFAGALLGAVSANLMFARPLLSPSSVARNGNELIFGELIATAGLVLIILLLIEFGRSSLVAPAVAAWIFAGHVFTSSTSFANPAVTFGRIFGDGIGSIAASSAIWFVIAQLVGAKLAVLGWYLLRSEKPSVRS